MMSIRVATFLERAIADRAIPIVLGYTNGHVGYICTAKAHEYGGICVP